jgi:hypothetical protein
MKAYITVCLWVMFNIGVAVAAEESTTPAIVLARAASIQADLAADKDKTIIVAFKGNANLTKQLDQSFSAAGFHTTTVLDQADVIYVIDGTYQAVRQLTGRVGATTAAKYFDNPKPPKPVRGGSILLLSNMNPTAFLAGNALDLIGDTVGLADKFNSMFGDPDGVCVYKCERWRYEQRAVLRVMRRQMRPEKESTKINAYIATTVNLALLPGALFEQAQTLLIAETGLPVPLLFKGETAVTVVQPTPIVPASSTPVAGPAPVQAGDKNTTDGAAKTDPVDANVTGVDVKM